MYRRKRPIIFNREDEKDIPVLKRPNLLNVNFYGNSKAMFDGGDYLWPEWYPKPGNAVHGLVVGTTGSMKTNRMINLLTQPPESGGIPYDTLYYFTDQNNIPTEHLKKHLQRKLAEHYKCSKQLYGFYVDEQNPNFKFKILPGRDFAKLPMSSIKSKHLLENGTVVHHHTIVVIDDAKVNQEELARLVQEGRNNGISVWCCQQDFTKDTVPREHARQSDVMFYCEGVSRAPWEEAQYLMKNLHCSKDQSEFYVQHLSNLKKGECMILSTNNDKLVHLGVAGDFEQYFPFEEDDSSSSSSGDSGSTDSQSDSAQD